MKMCRFLQFSLLAMLAGAIHANAGTTALADWCVNLNGDVNTACNGGGTGGASGTGSISLASFDTTLEPGTNNLGSVTATLGQGQTYAAFYADYDLDYAAHGSFTDSASIHGAPPAGVSYEADDPNTSNIFNDFSGNALTNSNNVGTPAGPPTVCCDAAFALAVGGFTLGAGDTETITFTVSTMAPTSGFYIQQTNSIEGDSIYLTYTDSGCQGPNCGGPPPPGVPEPSTFGLGLGAAGGLLMLVRRRAA